MTNLETEHFFIENCHWNTRHPYLLRAKSGVPYDMQPTMPQVSSTEDSAKVILQLAEAFYANQAAYKAAMKKVA